MITKEEVAHLRRVQEDGGLSDGQVLRLLNEVSRLAEDFSSMTEGMLDARSSWAVACKTLSMAEAALTEVREASAPFRELGRPRPPLLAFHDLDEDVVLFENSGVYITVGDVRRLQSAIAKARSAPPATAQSRHTGPGGNR